MKTIKIFLLIIITPFIFQSCTNEIIVEDHNKPTNNNISLSKLMESYDLWYIDYNATQGSGNIPFLTRAFTISFLNGALYANNNLAGIGSTGNGFGTRIGAYNYYPNSIRVFHDLYGTFELDVYQLANNKIKISDPIHKVTYYLVGYQRSNFDYNKLFNDNIHYFLQEYKAWEKVYASRIGALNDFDKENFIQFLAGGTDNHFCSSKDLRGTNPNNIYWDFTGFYGISKNLNPYTKNLTLDYDFWGNESFTLSVINDHRIRLFHTPSGTTYEFEGRGFIQYLRLAPVVQKQM
ncbi:nicotinic acid mononucleotide adenyltransferase [Flavobacterium oreochromis]|uniref:nicotinic acid mononucleotide adenyltransferase n=1 Tax=Flavobacterium oreochromis TaxID=2906078 RepID=UPI000B4C546B|nr:nicotinic acid mononucleotide adenyltransferase [Flavobacterium oreochromis]OWP78756.1 nicotinic acid mononucleotide adenyltransferase [Flavobacterium oreochromis]POR29463.1 nicotinic acid mononucleotide adenyltransferase [Flavobacterium columnare]QYS87466.1 nicotinic acid mononucleotide adenyltransferase [Flavobacterium oreochromis]